MADKEITRLQLHEKYMECLHRPIDVRRNYVLDFLKEKFKVNGDEKATKCLETFTNNFFFGPYYKRWQNTSRTNSKFLAKYGDWLQTKIMFPDIVVRSLSKSSQPSLTPSTSSRGKFKY